jgi:hypothetical protein
MRKKFIILMWEYIFLCISYAATFKLSTEVAALIIERYQGLCNSSSISENNIYADF